MSLRISELLDRRFAELGNGKTDAERAILLRVDKGTFSKIVSGRLKLTEKRARDWAQRLFPDDFDAAAVFAKELTGAGPSRALSVNDFCEWMVDQGGAVPADHFTELLTALQAPDIEKVLICCEYRDLPRAAPDAKYEYLAQLVGEAIAGGVSFAMFQPFGEDIPLPLDNKPDRPALNAAIYMMQIKTKCIDTYKLFWAEALVALGNMDRAKKPSNLRILKKTFPVDTGEVSLKEQAKAMKCSPDELLVSSRLQLYERSAAGCAHLGSGFQARMFYIRYTTKEDGTNHARILQWVSTPKRDLLVYRGPNEINPDALKDSFYPIPHFFDSPVGRLPLKIDDSDSGGPGVRKYLKQRPGGEGLPLPEVEQAISVWRGYVGKP